MKPYGIIYKLFNLINDKHYVGKTKETLEKRMKRHIGGSLEIIPPMYISRAIKKYGPENFMVTVIDYANSKEELNLKEKYYIKQYGKSYNIKDGGDGGNGGTGIPKGSTKENHSGIAQMAEKLTGRTKEEYPYLARPWKGQTKETCEWIRTANDKKRGRTKENHEGIRRQAEKIKGRKHSQEALEKISKASKGQNNPMSKTNIEKRKFKRDNLELFSFNKEIPPILPLEFQFKYTNKESLNIIN